VVALLLVHFQHALDREIIRFGSAAREDDLFRIGLDQLRDLLPGAFDGFFRGPPEGMVTAGRVAFFPGKSLTAAKIPVDLTLGFFLTSLSKSVNQDTNYEHDRSSYQFWRRRSPGGFAPASALAQALS